MTNLEDKIKSSEGFMGYQYDDHLGHPTIGYGTLLPLTEEEGTLLLRYRLRKMKLELLKKKEFVLLLPEEAQGVLYEMAYQLGVPGLLRFKKMWKALTFSNYEMAAVEMLDSKWATQTPERAKRLADIMRTVG